MSVITEFCPLTKGVCLILGDTIHAPYSYVHKGGKKLHITAHTKHVSFHTSLKDDGRVLSNI